MQIQLSNADLSRAIQEYIGKILRVDGPNKIKVVLPEVIRLDTVTVNDAEPPFEQEFEKEDPEFDPFKFDEKPTKKPTAKAKAKATTKAVATATKKALDTKVADATTALADAEDNIPNADDVDVPSIDDVALPEASAPEVSEDTAAVIDAMEGKSAPTKKRMFSK